MHPSLLIQLANLRGRELARQAAYRRTRPRRRRLRGRTGR
jgi:hypothetical protein